MCVRILRASMGISGKMTRRPVTLRSSLTSDSARYPVAVATARSYRPLWPCACVLEHLKRCLAHLRRSPVERRRHIPHGVHPVVILVERLLALGPAASRVPDVTLDLLQRAA